MLYQAPPLIAQEQRTLSSKNCRPAAVFSFEALAFAHLPLANLLPPPVWAPAPPPFPPPHITPAHRPPRHSLPLPISPLSIWGFSLCLSPFCLSPPAASLGSRSTSLPASSHHSRPRPPPTPSAFAYLPIVYLPLVYLGLQPLPISLLPIPSRPQSGLPLHHPARLLTSLPPTDHRVTPCFCLSPHCPSPSYLSGALAFAYLSLAYPLPPTANAHSPGLSPSPDLRLALEILHLSFSIYFPRGGML